MTKFFDIVYHIFMSFCKLCFIGMVGITAYVVFGRYVLKSSPVWGEPVVLMCMVYMSLISAALAIRKDSHIRMTIIDFLVPERVSDVMKCAAQIGIFCFSIFMIIYGWKFSLLAGKNVITGVGIKSMWLYLSVPVAGCAMCLMEIERLLNFIKRNTGKENRGAN
ncbi:TRAP transporter small permease [Marasmitruncus massiliensis]|uniref:TRAP transporter small permease n=1 Tax=Marasmitruncus massiliensis TaxID=1944642 RepID=UPI000C7A1B49|nr:TRAP transporter small permease [Marasmitruncus massiliensis]MBE6907864.1 TRAP transporter small permease [Oscillospiraceae bacterium]